MSASRYEYSITPQSETSFNIVSCHDPVTGIITRTMVASTERSFPSTAAFVGATFSRNRDGLIVLASKVEAAHQAGKSTPDQRLAGVVEGLKHQSPSGMATIFMAFENIPILTAAAVHAVTVLHHTQEGSTRFIDFASGNDLPPLHNLIPLEVCINNQELVNQYWDLQKFAIKSYLDWFPKVYDAYKKHFNIDDTFKDQKSALTARTFDTVRGYLLTGLSTSMVFVSNATTTQQMISTLAADRLPGESQLAASILALLAPQEDVPGYHPEIQPLLNHTQPNYVSRDEQQDLVKFFANQPGFSDLLSTRRSFAGLVEGSVDLVPNTFSAIDRIIAQQILVIHPSLKLNDIFKYVVTLNDFQKAEIGQVIFSRRDRFNLPAIASSGGPISLHFNIDEGGRRDLGRHRAWERITPEFETHVGLGEIPNTGFTQAAYLREIPEFKNIAIGMSNDMNHYYEIRQQFLDQLSKHIDGSLVDKVGMYLLPLAHQVDMTMNSDIHNMVHLQDIRIRPGAHIDVRQLIASANRQVAQSDPLYSSLEYSKDAVIVDDRDQFLRRD